MKANINVRPKSIDTQEGICAPEFGWINIKLIPETEEERRLFSGIAENHSALIEEDSGGPESVAEIICVTTSPEEIQMEISFPESPEMD